MSKDKPRISKSGVTSSGRFVLYTNSPEATDLDPSLVYYIKGNSLSPLYLTTSNTDTEDISADDGYIVEINGDGEDSGTESESSESSQIRGFKIPSLSDISIVSNSVVYDAAGNPTVTLVFKVKNSSGETLKGMNARVELL
jgi:hypothetical protein